MENLPTCAKCNSEYTYETIDGFACPDCDHHWSKEQETESSEDIELIVKDAHGNRLKDGDDVTVIKDIQVKGSATPIKAGVKIKDIRLVEPVNGHNIDVKIKGFGGLLLKSELVKKSL